MKTKTAKAKWNPATRRFETPTQTARLLPPTAKYQCPICKATVSGADFITSYRLIEGSGEDVYQTVQLCRTCRDSGL